MMSGYGPTDWKGCLVFIVVIPYLIVIAIYYKIKELVCHGEK